MKVRTSNFIDASATQTQWLYRRKMYCHEYGKDRTNVCVDLNFVSVCFICFYLQGIKIVILPVCQY